MSAGKIVVGALVLGVLGLATGLAVTAPAPLPEAALDGLTGDAENGRLVFATAGCASCHTAPDAESTDAPVLSGGLTFATQFGTFVAPNISPDPDFGIGAWSDIEIVSAVMRGVSPNGAHYFPVFPYAAYNKAEPSDMLDLVAYMRTLPASQEPSAPHDVGFPFNIRRSLGGWKLLFETTDWALEGDLTQEQERGRYIVEALAHCGECHTPRNALGGMDRTRWLAGADNPSGEGKIPNITPAALSWSEEDIAYYLETGFTPEFDSAGGEMAHVIQNLAQVEPSDRAAIAAYLKAVPAVAN